MPVDPAFDFQDLTEEQAGALIRQLADQLSTAGTHQAFSELLALVAYLGERVGDAARSLAATNSWSQVAQVSGTSKQAAWERWRG